MAKRVKRKKGNKQKENTKKILVEDSSELTGELVQFPGVKRDAPDSPAASFKIFAEQLQAGNLITAGSVLGTLLDIGPTRGIAAASHFADLCAKEGPQVVVRLQQIRHDLNAGKWNDALIAVMELFDLHGPIAVKAVKALDEIAKRDRKP